MEIGIALTELIIAVILLFIGLYFYKVKNTERAVLFLTGDYSDLDTSKICRVTGKRIMIFSVPFFIGIAFAIFNSGLSIAIAFALFCILLLYHLFDVSINRNKYKP